MADLAKKRSQFQAETQTNIADVITVGGVTRAYVKSAIDAAAIAGSKSKVVVTADTTITTATAVDYFGKLVEIKNGAVLTLASGLPDDFVCQAMATAVNGTVNYPGGTKTVSFSVNPIEVIHLGFDSYRIIEPPTPVVNNTGVPDSDLITTNISITAINLSTYKNKTLYLTTANVYTITIAAGVQAPLGLVVDGDGEIKLDIADAPAGSVNSLKADNNGKPGLLKIDVVGGVYKFIGTENAVYIPSIQTIPQIVGDASVIEYFDDFETTVIAGTQVSGKKSVYNLTPTYHTKTTPVQYNLLTVDVNNWLDANGTDQLISLTFDTPPTSGSYLYIAKVVSSPSNDQNMAGFCDGSVANNSARSALDDSSTLNEQIAKLWVRYTFNVNISRTVNGTDPQATNRVYATNDILMIYLDFNSTQVNMYVAKLADTTYSPEYLGYTAETGYTFASKPNFAVGGEFRGSGSGSDRYKGKFKKIHIFNRALTTQELTDIFNAVKSLNLT